MKLRYFRDSNLPNWKNIMNLPTYDERCLTVGIESLASRRNKLCARFIGDLISGRMDSLVKKIGKVHS